MKDQIIIKITLERIDSNVPRINSLIKGLVFDLQKEPGVEVKNYDQIKPELKGDTDGKE